MTTTPASVRSPSVDEERYQRIRAVYDRHDEEDRIKWEEKKKRERETLRAIVRASYPDPALAPKWLRYAYGLDEPVQAPPAPTLSAEVPRGVDSEPTVAAQLDDHLHGHDAVHVDADEHELARALDIIRAQTREGHEVNCRRQLAWLGLREGEPFALQTLGDPNYLALARSVDEAVELTKHGAYSCINKWGKMVDFEADSQGVYVIGNMLVGRIDELYEPGRWGAMPKGIITDERIRARRFFYLDIDTQRFESDGVTACKLPISATKTELHATVARSIFILKAIEADLAHVGVDHAAEVIGKMMSGNGVQAWFALANIGETPELHNIIREILAIWSVLFDHVTSHVDTSVHDAKRIAPLGGTMKRKGVKRELHRCVTFDGSQSPRRLSLDELRALVKSYRGKLTAEQRGRVGKILGVQPPRTAASSTSIPRSGGGLTGCNAVNIREVAAKLGIDPQAPACPGCHRVQSATAFLDGRNTLHCSSNTCATAGKKSWSPVDLVALLAFRCRDIKGSRGIVGQVLAWFKSNFGVTT